jgi:hypothetical protein
MNTETTGRNEIQAMNNKYREVLAWEAEFAQQIEELNNIAETDKEALEVASEILKTYEDLSNIFQVESIVNNGDHYILRVPTKTK